MNIIDEYAKQMGSVCMRENQIHKMLFQEYGVKQGLRDERGRGVLTGLTNISEVNSFKMENGERVQMDGKLTYRGYNIKDLVQGSLGRRFIFEEGAYLLLFGKLPTEAQLMEFHKVLAAAMTLPNDFTRDVIMKAASKDIMNSMTRSVLTLSSYDNEYDNLDVDNVLAQCIRLIAEIPMLAMYAYHAHNHYENNDSMYIHRPDENLSIAENILRLLRPDCRFTELEAHVLDVALLLHMEHGGGNNSTFTIRVVTSTGTDTYAATAAALSSLKGPKHGGANIKVMEMMDDIRMHIHDYTDEDEIRAYLNGILEKEYFDRKGLIYGIGHAIYTLSDPREVILKMFVEALAEDTGRNTDLLLYNQIEKLAPRLIMKKRHTFKVVSPNVDFYSGFVYNMMNIPVELYTPLFAIARMVGWSAHRIEELISANKIIRPAYMSLATDKTYVPREERR